jgi:hypothetical protein
MTRTLRAATVFIGNKLSLDERTSLSDGFVNDIQEWIRRRRRRETEKA